MENLKVVKYTSDKKEEWNAFIAVSKNGTFLFDRNFMEYHSDRFTDFSLMAYQNEKLVAVLPANIKGGVVYSHQGLTYGSLVLNLDAKTLDVIAIFKEVLCFINEEKIPVLIIKSIPTIYHEVPSEEISYLAFVLKADLYRRDTLSVLEMCSIAKNNISTNRKRGIKKALKNGLVVKEENNFDDFWNNVLIKNLKQKFKTLPVHSLEEIKSLKKYFPKKIRQFNVYENNEVIAGTTVFESNHVAHAQYISGIKNNLGGLDLLFDILINKVFLDKKYFDFGISNENNGSNINKGLLHWKEGFGARSVIHDFYEIKTENYKLLNNVLK